MSKTKLIHRVAVRETLMAIIAERRPHLAGKFTEVSASLYLGAHSAVISWLEQKVDSLPTTGKTIR